ncbi:alpha-hydroxy acid oxidase [Salinicola peritrichatus]|uniref:alpha-hydroxy acid oxidase n=1 Tax=Salinicola peritrichatus TaxID=1267424 RepID=UPI000DA15629|nr:alpha-hydroxy acid oxidase [Salinicola peritrichatus]
MKENKLSSILCLEDFESRARRHLPKPIFGYIQRGAERERSMRYNRDAFDRYRFVHRALIDVSHVSTRTTLFGTDYAAPVGIAPMGISALSTYRGDIVLARAASQHNVPMIMSGSSLIPLEEVAAAGGKWFQAYLPGDMDKMWALLDRVGGAGFENLVITVDHPTSPSKENYKRQGFTSPLRPNLSLAWQGVSHPAWLFGTWLKTLHKHGVPHFENHYVTRGIPVLSKNVNRDFSGRSHFSWRHVEAIRERWKGRIVIKGILHVDDAIQARSAGVDGVILSNHGGRQIDGAVSPLSVLPSVVEAVGDMPVMVDSGFRRGTDVLTALALGAKFVFIGRPFNYAAACAGEAGVSHGIRLIGEEIRRNMALLGITTIEDMDESRLYDVCKEYA